MNKRVCKTACQSNCSKSHQASEVSGCSCKEVKSEKCKKVCQGACSKSECQHIDLAHPQILKSDVPENCLVDDEKSLLLKKQSVLRHAKTASYHTLLPISVQEALKRAVWQYPNNVQQKNIAINDVTERALRKYTHCFKDGLEV